MIACIFDELMLKVEITINKNKNKNNQPLENRNSSKSGACEQSILRLVR